jgi:L-phenylalanine/L-methionine N-acetyltransferase
MAGAVVEQTRLAREMRLPAPLGMGIRRAAPSDALAFAALMREPQVYANVFDLPHPTMEQWHAMLCKVTADDHFLCAVCDGKLLGWASLQVHAPARRRHAGVLGIAVAPDCWGRGVGTVLIDQLLVLADDWLNLQRVELSVFTGNERAVALYARFGFQIEGLQRGFAFQDGRFVDFHLMARLHPQPASIERS